MIKVIITEANFLYYYPLFDTRMVMFDKKIFDKLSAYREYLYNGVNYNGICKKGEIEQLLKNINDLIADTPSFIRSGGEGYIDMNTDKLKILTFRPILGSNIEVDHLFPAGIICKKTNKYIYYLADQVSVRGKYVKVISSFFNPVQYFHANRYYLVAKIGVLDERISEDIRKDTFLIRQEDCVKSIKSQAEGYSKDYATNVEFFEEYAVDDYSLNKCLQFIKRFGNSEIFEKLTASLNEAYQRNLRKQVEKNISNQINSSEFKNEVQQKQDDRKPEL